MDARYSVEDEVWAVNPAGVPLLCEVIGVVEFPEHDRWSSYSLQPDDGELGSFDALEDVVFSNEDSACVYALELWVERCGALVGDDLERRLLKTIVERMVDRDNELDSVDRD